MSEPGTSLSKVNPVLVAALICDAAVQDPSSGKKTLVGIFDRMMTAELPAYRPMSLYLKLTDAEGQYKLEIRFVHSETGNVLARGMSPEVEFKNRLLSVD